MQYVPNAACATPSGLSSSSLPVPLSHPVLKTSPLLNLRTPLHCLPSHHRHLLLAVRLHLYVSLSCFLCSILIHQPGCDFNGPIWNITGVPTAGDDVIITSDVQTTIFANSTSISLNSLWIGGNGTSAAITIVLTNCVLNITESTSMSYTSSCLHLNLTSLPKSR